MADASADASRTQREHRGDTTSNNSWVPMLAGAALVGAAAGYAALAFRFRNFGATANSAGRFASGSAEMRAAEAFTKDWVRSVEEGARVSYGGTKHAAGDTQQQQRQQQQTRQQQQHAGAGMRGGFGVDGPPDWALQELGLQQNGAIDLGTAKAAYRARAREVHPDAPGGGDEERFKRLGKAWEAVQTACAKES